MRNLFVICVILFMLGCKDDSGESVDITVPAVGEVWSSQSERLFIVDDTGMPQAGDEGPGYVIYDYSRDMLSQAAKTALYNLTLTEEDLHCAVDAGFYTITITVNTGIEKKYISNNKGASDFPERIDGSINIEDISALILLLY